MSYGLVSVGRSSRITNKVNSVLMIVRLKFELVVGVKHVPKIIVNTKGIPSVVDDDTKLSFY
jgi:hypothetical protein